MYVKLYPLNFAFSFLWSETIPALGSAPAVSVSAQNGKIEKVSHAADCWSQWDFIARHILRDHLTSGSVNLQPGDGDGTEITVLILYGHLHNEANDLC